MWQSTDPAFWKGEYLPQMPTDEQERRQLAKDPYGYWKQKLPGMGGVYNAVNGNVYAYGGQNPVKLVDPDGNASLEVKLSGSISGFGYGFTVSGGLGNATDHDNNESETGVVLSMSAGATTETGGSGGISFTYNEEATSLDSEAGKSSVEGKTIIGEGSGIIGLLKKGNKFFPVSIDLSVEKPFKPKNDKDKFFNLGFSIGKNVDPKDFRKGNMEGRLEETKVFILERTGIESTSGEIYISP